MCMYNIIYTRFISAVVLFAHCVLSFWESVNYIL